MYMFIYICIPIVLFLIRSSFFNIKEHGRGHEMRKWETEKGKSKIEFQNIILRIFIQFARML